MAGALGHSLKLDDGDLAFLGPGLVEIEGPDNLVQALVLRVLTPLGSDPFATAYGLDVRATFTRPVAAHVMRQLIQLNLVSTLSADPRVREVRDIVFPDDADQVAANPAADADAARRRRRRRLWAVEVTIIAIDGSQQTLQLTIGA